MLLLVFIGNSFNLAFRKLRKNDRKGRRGREGAQFAAAPELYRGMWGDLLRGVGFVWRGDVHKVFTTDKRAL